MEALITFADGATLTVEKNGDCYILPQKQPITGNLSHVTVESGEGSREYNDAILIECASVDGRYWFAFNEESEADRTIRELQESNAMLTECILEMSEIIYGGE